MGDAMAASRQKHAMKKRKKATTIHEDDIPEDHVVKVEEEKEID